MSVGARFILPLLVGLAILTWLTRHPETRGRFTFVELGAPSRVEIPRAAASNEGARGHWPH